MSQRVNVRLNSKGHRALLRSPEVRALIRRKVDQAAESAGSGYVSGVDVGPNRVRGYVLARSASARRDNASNNTLLRVLGRMR